MSLNRKKRKAALGPADTASSKRLKTLDTFFPPQVTARPLQKHNKTDHALSPVTLNQEQIRVLRMVVEEGKNVFFTGAAGKRFYSSS